MNLIDEESHRILLWAVRLFEVGSLPSETDLIRLADPRRPIAPEIAAALSGQRRHFSETALDSLYRRGLIEDVGEGRVAPSETGRAVVLALGLYPDQAPLFEIVESDLRSADPLAFARIVSRISALERPMVVDPHGRRTQIEYLAYHTGVTRVLLSDRVEQDELEAIAEFVEGLTDREQKLRVRVAPAEALHDRHVINDDRVLQVSVPVGEDGAGTTVVSEPTDLGTAARAYYRRVWKDARRVASYRP